MDLLSAEVLIAGAGLAGLAAADELVRNGVEPLVLEARRSVGGRAVDAEFVEGSAAELEGFRIEDCAGEHYCVFGGRVQRVTPHTPLLRVAGGFEAVAEALAEGLAVETLTAVRAVEWAPGSVLLHTSQGPVRGRAAILALPAAVVASMGVGAHAIQMTAEICVRLTLDSAVWEERFPRLLMLHSAHPVLPVWWTAARAGSAVITGWASGRRARNLSAVPRQKVRQEAVAALAHLLREHPRELMRNVRGCDFHDWQSDPFARGGRAARGSHVEPLGGTLFFAGEYTGDGPPNALAAIRSGRRAARQLLAETQRCRALSNS